MRRALLIITGAFLLACSGLGPEDPVPVPAQPEVLAEAVQADPDVCCAFSLGESLAHLRVAAEACVSTGPTHAERVDLAHCDEPVQAPEPSPVPPVELKPVQRSRPTVDRGRKIGVRPLKGVKRGD